MIKKKKEKKDDHERRESNTGPERSKPRALTTFFLIICLLLPDYIFVFSTINDEFWLWGGSGKSTDTRRYDIAMHYYIFFFFKITFVT